VTRIASIPIGLLLAVLAGGCQQVRLDAAPLLSEPRMGRSSVVLDLFFVRLPLGDERINKAIWPEVDEQPFPATLQRRLAEHGFRAGVCATHPPAELERLLNEQPGAAPPDLGETVVTDLVVEPFVKRRHLQIPAGDRAEIIASATYDALPLLEIGADGQVSGQTFRQAEGVFSVFAYPEADGRVRLRLRPELQHGQPRQQFSQRDHHLVLEPGRPRKLFEDLVMEARLAPGEMLLVTTRPQQPGSVGHYFFTESAADGLNQKLLVIRLSQTQHDSALGHVLDLDGASGE
jgi:hypothetical protein